MSNIKLVWTHNIICSSIKFGDKYEDKNIDINYFGTKENNTHRSYLMEVIPMCWLAGWKATGPTIAEAPTAGHLHVQAAKA